MCLSLSHIGHLRAGFPRILAGVLPRIHYLWCGERWTAHGQGREAYVALDVVVLVEVAPGAVAPELAYGLGQHCGWGHSKVPRMQLRCSG